jgi:hypothetical protein
MTEVLAFKYQGLSLSSSWFNRCSLERLSNPLLALGIHLPIMGVYNVMLLGAILAGHEVTAMSVAEIRDSCTNMLFDNGYLIGDCVKGDGSTATIRSAVWMDRMLTNHDGHLEVSLCNAG